ncbi:PilN domain-containing protein [Effusibacillus pohliae]|uniref:PilN domain-containing protein n=1 Tax=Effusibacillus pohliae TaxID=232270 RepID=UPI0003705844|nr:hypothetical protein [Effusibacillus pohliae]
MQINLLPIQSSSVTVRTIVLSAAAGALLLGNLVAVGEWWSFAGEKRQAQQTLTSHKGELAKLQEKAAQVGKAQELQRQSQALEKWADSRPPLEDEVRLLSSLLPPRSYLTAVQYDSTGLYQVQAELPDMESVATYLYALQHNSRVAAVSVKSVILQESIQNSAGTSPAQSSRSGSVSLHQPGRQSGSQAWTPPPNAANTSPTHRQLAQAASSAGGGIIGQLLSLLPWHTEVAHASSDGGYVPQPNPAAGGSGNPGTQPVQGGAGSASGIGSMQDGAGGQVGPQGGVNSAGSPQSGGSAPQTSDVQPVQRNYKVEIEVTIAR